MNFNIALLSLISNKRHDVCTCFVCLLDNILQPVVLQQAEPAEMD